MFDLAKIQIVKIADTLLSVPLIGAFLLRIVVGLVSPYSGSISPSISALTVGKCNGAMSQRRSLQNPFGSIHACALMNLGELTTGLALLTLLQKDNYQGIPVKLEARYYKKARGTIRAHVDLGESLDPLIFLDVDARSTQEGAESLDTTEGAEASAESSGVSLKELFKQVEVSCDLVDATNEKVATVTAVWSVKRKRPSNSKAKMV